MIDDYYYYFSSFFFYFFVDYFSLNKMIIIKKLL